MEHTKNTLSQSIASSSLETNQDAGKNSRSYPPIPIYLLQPVMENSTQQ